MRYDMLMWACDRFAGILDKISCWAYCKKFRKTITPEHFTGYWFPTTSNKS